MTVVGVEGRKYNIWKQEGWKNRKPTGGTLIKLRNVVGLKGRRG